MSRIAKAVTALLLSLVGALSTWAVAYFPDNADVQRNAALALVLVTALGTAYGTYLVPNRAPKGEPPDPTQSEQGPYDASADRGSVRRVEPVNPPRTPPDTL